MLSLFKKNIIKCSSNSACLLVVWLWYRARFFSMPWWRHDSYLEAPEQWKCQQQSAISSRTPFICNSNFTSSFNTSWFFLALSSLLGNSVFQFSLKFIPIVNIFHFKKNNGRWVYYWEQLQNTLLSLHNLSDRCSVTNRPQTLKEVM